MKEGFDEQGKQIAELSKQVADILIIVKEQGKQIVNLASTVTELKEEAFQNGDALAKLIVRFEDESAAHLMAHDRIENRLERMEYKTDLRLNRIEHHLGLVPIPFPKE